MPAGIEIDCQDKNLRETGVAFCTEKMATAITQSAITQQIKTGAMGFITSKKWGEMGQLIVAHSPLMISDSVGVLDRHRLQLIDSLFHCLGNLRLLF